MLKGSWSHYASRVTGWKSRSTSTLCWYRNHQYNSKYWVCLLFTSVNRPNAGLRALNESSSCLHNWRHWRISSWHLWFMWPVGLREVWDTWHNSLPYSETQDAKISSFFFSFLNTWQSINRCRSKEGYIVQCEVIVEGLCFCLLRD